MKTQGMNTHTQYNFHARALQKASEAITQTNKYLLPDSPHYLPAYIAQLEALLDSDEPNAELETKIATAKTNFTRYSKRADEALQVIANHPALLAQLEENNDIYLTPPEKQDECLYVMDSETCQSSCVNWNGLLENPEQDNGSVAPERFIFKGKQDIELTGEHQTDALRVWQHNVTVEDLKIIDNRCYTDAHRDAVQLIPPPIFKMVDDVYVRIADQMAGAVLENTTIKGCEISAPLGPLQGIFASDGLQRNLCISNNDIGTCGSHAISISGLLDGGVISGNTLRELEGGQRPTISLYPARIGGNMADDGVVSILSFARHEAHKLMEYGPVEASNNTLIDKQGNSHPLEIDDARHMIPATLLKLAIGLKDFDYHGYLKQYSSLTLGQYRQHDPFGSEQMEEWLTLRTQEFTHGRDAQSPLGAISGEQKKIGARFLAPALEALKNGSADEIRLVDLEYTAIRSFAMKRLAIMHGKVEPLVDIALINERRDLMLRFLLEPAQRTNLVKVATVDIAILNVEDRKAVPQLPYTLFFSSDHIYNGTTNGKGIIALDELPVGPYILTINNPKFIMTAGSRTVNLPSTDLAVTNLAKSLLKDFSNKQPIVKAWLQHDINNEAVGIARIAQYLSATGATTNAHLNDQQRQQCLSVFGMGSSRRESHRKSTTVLVSCPEPVANKGCLFAVTNLMLGLLKKN